MAPGISQTQPSTTTTTTTPKYGPSAVRDIRFVTGAKTPYVQVKQRKNGQYVVIERLPVHHKPRNHGLPTLQQSLAESEVRLRSLKPDWTPTTKSRELERKDGGTLSLPPIHLGWNKKAQAMVGSFENVHHEPGGGKKVIPRQNVKWYARAKVGSLDNLKFKSPRRVETTQSDPVLSPRTRGSSTFGATPRYGGLAHTGSLGSSMHYTPGGAEVVVKPRRFEHVRSRVGSLDNVSHVPGGGDVIVENRKNKWKAESQVGSLDNVKHCPGGGKVTITSERLRWQNKPRVGSLDNADHTPGGGQVRIPKNKVKWAGRSRVDSLANIHHKPGGGVVNITNNTLKWVAQPRVDNKPPRRRPSLDSLDSY
ncbi:hypothetical protein ACOMHN_035730 [Nucella lapillus]